MPLLLVADFNTCCEGGFIVRIGLWASNGFKWCMCVLFYFSGGLFLSSAF